MSRQYTAVHLGDARCCAMMRGGCCAMMRDDAAGVNGYAISMSRAGFAYWLRWLKSWG